LPEYNLHLYGANYLPGFLEYAYDTAKLDAEKSMKNVFVTNGSITKEALKEMAPYLYTANIDLKSFSDEFYRETCGSRLQPVLEAIQLYKTLGVWIEVTPSSPPLSTTWWRI